MRILPIGRGARANLFLYLRCHNILMLSTNIQNSSCLTGCEWCLATRLSYLQTSNGFQRHFLSPVIRYRTSYVRSDIGVSAVNHKWSALTASEYVITFTSANTCDRNKILYRLTGVRHATRLG